MVCSQCQSLDRQLADAQLQLDTLQNRQAVTDQKLSAERRKYEDLRHKWEAAETERLAERGKTSTTREFAWPRK